MLDELTLPELQAEKTRIDCEIKRIYCTRAERSNREIKMAELAQLRREVEEGIREISSLTPAEVKRLKIGARVRQAT